MDRLRDVVQEAGFDNVATFIASGNVIFDAVPSCDLTDNLEAALLDGLGFEVPVYLRTAPELLAVADRRPFGHDQHSLEVSFLPATPTNEAVKTLIASATGSDRLAVIEREVYWSHIGPRSESSHKESTVVKILGMQTTQRSATTIRRIADRFLR